MDGVDGYWVRLGRAASGLVNRIVHLWRFHNAARTHHDQQQVGHDDKCNGPRRREELEFVKESGSRGTAFTSMM
jgi:hypothetical protein